MPAPRLSFSGLYLFLPLKKMEKQAADNSLRLDKTIILDRKMNSFHAVNPRLFLALWPDKATCNALTAWQSALSGRKVPPENLHMTLVFLGEQPQGRIPELARLIASLPPFAIHLVLDKQGYFTRSKIAWAGTSRPPEALMQLCQILKTSLPDNILPPGRPLPFRPHITLARKSSRPQHGEFSPVSWHASRLVLVESRFRQNKKGAPPQYIPLAERILSN